MALLDVGLVAAILLFLLHDAKAVHFHLVFVLLTLGAFYWTLRGLVVHSTLTIAVVTIGMLSFYYTGVVHGEEVSEIPMMTAIFLLVFAIARQRSKAQLDLETANQHLEQKVAARTAALEEEIAVRRETEQRLRASEEQYIRLIDLSFDAVSITYLDGSIVYLNRAGLQAIGATSLDEVRGRSIFDFTHSDSYEALRSRFRSLQRSEDGLLLMEE